VLIHSIRDKFTVEIDAFEKSSDIPFYFNLLFSECLMQVYVLRIAVRTRFVVGEQCGRMSN
jgi:hypothetical protein